jgi:hypothetical protein
MSILSLYMYYFIILYLFFQIYSLVIFSIYSLFYLNIYFLFYLNIIFFIYSLLLFTSNNYPFCYNRPWRVYMKKFTLTCCFMFYFFWGFGWTIEIVE